MSNYAVERNTDARLANTRAERVWPTRTAIAYCCPVAIRKATMKVHDIVKPKSAYDAFSINATFGQEITVDTEFKVLLVVLSGEDYHGTIKRPGIIVQPIATEEISYPYIWDCDRFSITGKQAYHH